MRADSFHHPSPQRRCPVNVNLHLNTYAHAAVDLSILDDRALFCLALSEILATQMGAWFVDIIYNVVPLVSYNVYNSLHFTYSKYHPQSWQHQQGPYNTPITDISSMWRHLKKIK